VAEFSINEMRTLVGQLVERVGLDVTLRREGKTYHTKCIFKDRVPWLLSYGDQIVPGDIVSLARSGEEFKIDFVGSFPGPEPMTAKVIGASLVTDDQAKSE
jgi:hypothetical protein